jgi:hypothetical protein
MQTWKLAAKTVELSLITEARLLTFHADDLLDCVRDAGRLVVHYELEAISRHQLHHLAWHGAPDALEVV